MGQTQISYLTGPLLPPQGIIVEQVVNGGIARKTFRFVSDAGLVSELWGVLLIVFSVLLIFKCIKAFED